MITYVRRYKTVKVSSTYNCGATVMVNRYARIDLNNSCAQRFKDCDCADIADCFDMSMCCDDLERSMIEAMKNCLRPQIAPQSLYKRLQACMDCLCD